MRNYVRNYTATFFGIVPIEERQAILPVPRAQHLIKRCKYEFFRMLRRHRKVPA